MKVKISVREARFDPPFVTVVYGRKPLSSEIAEINTLHELDLAVSKVNANINQNAVIDVFSLDRKIKGFDKWLDENKELLQVKIG